MSDRPDRWHRWLLDGRFGGDAAQREKVLTEFLYPVRDAVLDKAELRPGDTLLDVGAGDGLIAFGALERLGPASQVIFSDISADLLDHCRTAAAAEGLIERCRWGASPAGWPCWRTRRSMSSLPDPCQRAGSEGGCAVRIHPATWR